MMGSRSFQIGLLLLLISMEGCSHTPRHLGRREYIKWVNSVSSGLIKSKIIGGVKFTLQYKPIDYLVLSGIGDRTVTNGAFDSLKLHYAGLEYYDLTIDPSSGNENILKYQTHSMKDYVENLDYYSFGMKDDLRLLIGDTSTPCVLYNFDNSHDLSKHSTAVFAFEYVKGHEKNDRVIQYNASRLELGFVKLQIEASDLNRIPKLNLSEL